MNKVSGSIQSTFTEYSDKIVEKYEGLVKIEELEEIWSSLSGNQDFPLVRVPVPVVAAVVEPVPELLLKRVGDPSPRRRHRFLYCNIHYPMLHR